MSLKTCRNFWKVKTNVAAKYILQIANQHSQQSLLTVPIGTWSASEFKLRYRKYLRANFWLGKKFLSRICPGSYFWNTYNLISIELINLIVANIEKQYSSAHFCWKFSYIQSLKSLNVWNVSNGKWTNPSF